MLKSDIRTDKDALVYITECNLATVETMAFLKSKSKSEYGRQISIAQTGIDYVMPLEEKHLKSPRVKKVVVKFKGNVQNWIDAEIAKYAK